MRKLILPLCINVLTLFTALVCLVAGGIIAYGYYKSSETALHSAHQLLRRIGDSVVNRTQTIFDTAVVTVDSYAFLNSLGEKPTIHSHPLSQIFFKFLENNPDFTSIYVAFNDGDCYIVSSLRDERKQLMGAPDSAVWYTETIGHLPTGQRYSLRKFMDADHVLLDSEVIRNISLDPRTRDWFKQASSADMAVLSDVYVFAHSNVPGMTISRRFDARIPGVIGIDISLSNLSHFLGRQVSKDSRIMLFDPSGELYAYPDIRKMVTIVVENGEKKSVTSSVGNFDDPVYASLMSSFWKNHEQPFHDRVIQVGDASYLALVAALSPRHGKQLFLGIAVPQEVFITPLNAIGGQAALVSLALLLLFMPLVYLASKRISRPLQTLTRQAETLALLRLERPVATTSRIVEIRALTTAMEKLRKQFKIYAAYLPRPVIDKLIANDIPPVLGGVRKELSIFFSSINGFNQLAESLSPEQVANSLSGYFQIMSSALQTCGGTMEKFSGDTLMTFWNAPSDDALHAFHSCLGALRCKMALLAFNQQRKELNQPVLTARIGIHSGLALVGNIGSAEHMEYTAMGTACVLTARIQRLNKALGTSILISETTRNAVGDSFLTRFAGRIPTPDVDAGGRINVYELLGAPPDAEHELQPFALSSRSLELVADWNATMALYLGQDFSTAAETFAAFQEKYGNDPLAESYQALAQQYADTPPDEDWEGELSIDAR